MSCHPLRQIGTDPAIQHVEALGITVFLIEHRMDVADYGYVLENGHLAGSGPADKLKNDPVV